MSEKVRRRYAEFINDGINPTEAMAFVQNEIQMALTEKQLDFAREKSKRKFELQKLKIQSEQEGSFSILFPVFRFWAAAYRSTPSLFPQPKNKMD